MVSFVQAFAQLTRGNKFALLPGKGESLTENVISMVGALIFTKGSGSTWAGSQMVSPIVTSPMPDRAIILPAEASLTCARKGPQTGKG